MTNETSTKTDCCGHTPPANEPLTPLSIVLPIVFIGGLVGLWTYAIIQVRSINAKQQCIIDDQFKIIEKIALINEIHCIVEEDGFTFEAESLNAIDSGYAAPELLNENK